LVPGQPAVFPPESVSRLVGGQPEDYSDAKKSSSLSKRWVRPVARSASD
jgi:hypothetical protein